jgi:hypothetical protein
LQANSTTWAWENKETANNVENGKTIRNKTRRWHNKLDPNVRKNSWSKSEERLLVKAHKKYGNKWVNISRLLKGR